MMRRWRVRLHLARDDDGPLSDEGIEALTGLLSQEQAAKPAVTRGDLGTVVVQLTIDAKDDTTARSTAEQQLREGANQVWSELGLPPFTIAYVDAMEERYPGLPGRPG
jgi:hypothetical protein